MTSRAQVGEVVGKGDRPPPIVREDSPIFSSPRLKEVILDAALRGEITTEEVDDLFLEYGLRGA